MSLRERGSVTVYALIASAALSLAMLIAAQATSVIRLQHEVAAAADLAAVAAATKIVEGGDGCAAAREIARRNDVHLTKCQLSYEVATVTARAATAKMWGKRFVVQRRARAGPADYLVDP